MFPIVLISKKKSDNIRKIRQIPHICNYFFVYCLISIERKETLKETKKDLLARVKFLNQRIFNLKELEFNFKNKENALSCLENLILEMTNENFDNG